MQFSAHAFVGAHQPEISARLVYTVVLERAPKIGLEPIPAHRIKYILGKWGDGGIRD